MALNDKQRRFVDEYLIDLNGTQAAIRAGYSKRTANEQAARLLANVSVRSHLQTLMDKRAERVERTADDVLRDIGKVKESCMAEVYDKEGNATMANHASALKALELEGRHLKMFTDKVEHSGKVSLESLIADD